MMTSKRFVRPPASGSLVLKAVAMLGLGLGVPGCRRNPPDPDLSWFAPARETMGGLVDDFHRDHGRWPRDETELFGERSYRVWSRARTIGYTLSRRTVKLTLRSIDKNLPKYSLGFGGRDPDPFEWSRAQK